MTISKNVLLLCSIFILSCNESEEDFKCNQIESEFKRAEMTDISSILIDDLYQSDGIDFSLSLDIGTDEYVEFRESAIGSYILSLYAGDAILSGNSGVTTATNVPSSSIRFVKKDGNVVYRTVYDPQYSQLQTMINGKSEKKIRVRESAGINRLETENERVLQKIPSQ